MKNFPLSKLTDITQIHALAPLFTYVNKENSSGMSRHIRIITYEHNHKDFFDITEIVAKATQQKYSTAGILVKGTGFSATDYINRDFCNAYKLLTNKDFIGEKNKYKKNELNFISNDMADFLKKCDNNLKYATFEEQDNIKFVLEEVKKYGNSLTHATNKAQRNKKVVIAAILNEPRALKYASPKLRNTEEIVYIAVANDIGAIQHASERIQKAVNNYSPQNPLKYFEAYFLEKDLSHTLQNKTKIKSTKI